MNDLPDCPQCRMENTYPDGDLLICPDCGHECPATATATATAPEDSDRLVVKDAHGKLLADGDSVVLIKDLRLKGSSTVIKGGTKIKGIRLVSGDHEIDCRVDGMSIMLKAQYLKKA
jgi:protein PhnA